MCPFVVIYILCFVLIICIDTAPISPRVTNLNLNCYNNIWNDADYKETSLYIVLSFVFQK